MEAFLLKVVCVKYGDWCSPYGADYVNRLFDGVKRHLSTEHEFICFTDDPKGLDPGIRIERFPETLSGWWNKLQLFRPGILDGRVFFLDLDTVITSRIDDLASYDGEFIALRDFYRPDGLGSGLMAWDASKTGDIWQTFDLSGRPCLSGGDQAWIEIMRPDCDRWQVKYPGKVVSYKADAQFGVPSGASVVCFHGKPRPHEVTEGWVPDCWKAGGATVFTTINNVGNVNPDIFIEQMRENCKRDLPWFVQSGVTTKHAVIVGGAPSLTENLKHIRERKKRGHRVVACNNAWRPLVRAFICPDIVVCMDAREGNAEFFKDAPDGPVYLIGSVCHPSVFEALEGKKVVVWHPDFCEARQIDILESHPNKPGCLIGGGGMIGLRAMYIAYLLGHRRVHAYGMDSCYRDDRHHAYPQSLNDGETVLEVLFRGRRYKIAPWMGRQANEFKDTWRALMSRGCLVEAHGEGLLQDVCRHLISQNLYKESA